MVAEKRSNIFCLKTHELSNTRQVGFIKSFRTTFLTAKAVLVIACMGFRKNFFQPKGFLIEKKVEKHCLSGSANLFYLP
jgi:hypothetical protein